MVPALNQLNIVTKDFDKTIDFYRRLGVDIAEVPPARCNSTRQGSDGGRFPARIRSVARQ